MEAENASRAETDRTLVVTGAEMATVLTDPKHLRYISPFLAREATVGEVARALDSTLSTTYRRVRRYCDLGILEVAREVERQGKALKVYRTVADAFFVPNRLTDGQEVSSARWYAHWEEELQRGLRHAYGDHLEGWGQSIHRDDGVFTTSLARGPDEVLDALGDDMPALYNRFHDSLYLEFDEAKALQRQLDALFDRYTRQEGRQRYMMRISFVPVTEDAEIIL